MNLPESSTLGVTAAILAFSLTVGTAMQGIPQGGSPVLGQKLKRAGYLFSALGLVFAVVGLVLWWGAAGTTWQGIGGGYIGVGVSFIALAINTLFNAKRAGDAKAPDKRWVMSWVIALIIVAVLGILAPVVQVLINIH